MADISPTRTVTQGLTSLVVPVYNESDNIIPLLELIRTSVKDHHETLLVYDFEDDTTLPPAKDFALNYRPLRLVRNDLGKGVLQAMRAGLAAAEGDVVVIVMADLADDVTQLDEMARRVRYGNAVVAGSRYVRGGRQIGGPPLKRTLSRMAGLSLRWLTGIGTHDATNNFKAYSPELLESVRIESNMGFELALELTTKAHLAGFLVDEIPTTWRDRTAGESRFRVFAWMPGYLKWYFRCIGGTWSGKASRARRQRQRAPQMVPDSI